MIMRSAWRTFASLPAGVALVANSKIARLGPWYTVPFGSDSSAGKAASGASNVPSISPDFSACTRLPVSVMKLRVTFLARGTSLLFQ